MNDKNMNLSQARNLLYVFYFEKEHLSIDFGPDAASFRLLKNC